MQNFIKSKGFSGILILISIILAFINYEVWIKVEINDRTANFLPYGILYTISGLLFIIGIFRLLIGTKTGGIILISLGTLIILSGILGNQLPILIFGIPILVGGIFVLKKQKSK